MQKRFFVSVYPKKIHVDLFIIKRKEGRFDKKKNVSKFNKKECIKINKNECKNEE